MRLGIMEWFNIGLVVSITVLFMLLALEIENIDLIRQVEVNVK